MASFEDRRKLRAILAALRARTTERGCTEAEALAAAEKVSELLSKHGIADATELEFDQWEMDIGRRTVVDSLFTQVATFCHCKVWYSRDVLRQRWTIVYFGRWGDVAVAEYLHTLLTHHIRAAARAYRKTPEYTRRRSAKTKREALKAFHEGLALGLRHKLWDIQWRRVPKGPPGSDHRALVLLPLAAVEAELERRGKRFGKALAPVKGAARSFDREKGSGEAAAWGIDINAGVGADSRSGVAGLLR